MEGENTVVQGAVDNSTHTESSAQETTDTSNQNMDKTSVVESFGNEVSDNQSQNEEMINTQEDTVENTETKDNQTDSEDKEFDPDSIDFEEEEKPFYKDIEGYDLEFAKDILDFDSEDAVNYIKGELSELKALGFSQAQAEKYINSHLKAYRDQQAQDQELRSEKHIKEKLNDKLTREEKGNYKAILNWVKEVSSDGSFPREWVGDVMSNPNLVKILNAMYKNKTSNNKVQEIPQPVTKATMSVKDAVAKYKDWIVKEKGASIDKTTEFINGLRPYIAEKDMESFNQIFKSVTRK